jgi:hypothetical protein
MTRILALVALTCTTVGCGFQTGTFKEFTTTAVGRDPTKALSESKVWIRSFSHRKVTGVSSAFAVGTGGSASGISVTRSTFDEAPPFVVEAVQRLGVFATVTPVQLGAPCDLILEGNVEAKWEVPWWTLVQLVDLWVHAWFLPTLGKSLNATAEVRLYDLEYRLLRAWTVTYRKSYVGDIWWAMTHGGAYDIGHDVAMQREVVDYAFSEIRPQLEALDRGILARAQNLYGPPSPRAR